MIVSSHISDKAVKGEASQIQGRGLFAIAPIPTGEIVAIKGGHIVDTATLHSLPERRLAVLPAPDHRPRLAAR